MKLSQMTAWQLKEKLADKEISNRDIMKSVLEQIDLKEDNIKAFITIKDKNKLLAEADAIDKKRIKGDKIGILAGLPVAVKDNICTSDIPTTCASKMLKNFTPPYNAGVTERLIKADAIIIGKTNLDEFAMGSSTENSAMQITRNPHNTEYVPGGTSGGSAAAIAADETILAIGSDTGGSIRQPASYCGTVGVKPSYGLVSRYGLVAHGSSLDQIGPLAKDVKDAALTLSAIAGHDHRDSTNLSVAIPDYSSLCNNSESFTIGVPEEYFGEGLDKEVFKKVKQAISLMGKSGCKIKPISLPNTPYGIAAYYIISCCEASSNLARYTGVHYGYRDKDSKELLDLYLKSRSKGFGKEVQRRIMLGTYALSAGYYDAYYLKASRIRTLIIQDFNKAFESCDIIAHPVAPGPAFKIGDKTADPLTMYLVDAYTVFANMTGCPAISIPCGKTENQLPIGMQLVANRLDETTLFKAAFAAEKILKDNGVTVK